jgi:hypothetical protein
MIGVKEGMKFVAFKEGKVIKHSKTGEVLDVETIETGLIEIKDVRDKTASASSCRKRIRTAHRLWHHGAQFEQGQPGRGARGEYARPAAGFRRTRQLPAQDLPSNETPEGTV